MNTVERYLTDKYNSHIMKGISRTPAITNNGVKILFAYCLNIFPMSQYHDYLLAQALRLRGAKIVPMICGGLQPYPCSVFGGVWGDEFNTKHCQSCKRCIKSDIQTWEEWFGITPIIAKDFINEDQYIKIVQYIDNLEIEKYETWEYKGIFIGKMAATILKNNWLVSSVNLDDQNKDRIRKYSLNVALMTYASEVIIEKVQPDIIYGNDSFYYPWAIVQELAQKKGVPYYNAYSIGKKNHYSYALNESVVSMPLRKAWESYKKNEMSNNDKQIIDDYLSKRYLGQDMMINTACPNSNANSLDELRLFDRNKPTALIATNVTWDAAALDKELFYDNILEWVVDTIIFFTRHPEWQLIVKAHPGEKNPLIPEARERIVQYIKHNYQDILSANVFLLDADTNISIYELLPKIDCGIVYTTTAGIEMACSGIPVICVANCFYRKMGFTFDPENKEQYYNTIRGILEKEEKYLKDVSSVAKQFFYLYYFVYLFPNTWFSYEYWDVPKLHIKEGRELYPGNNQVCDYICDRILNKQEIIGAEKIPQFREEYKNGKNM